MEVDLGVCQGRWLEGPRDRAAIILPGARYGVEAPLLWFAREVLQALGWSVLQAVDTFDGSEDPAKWVADRWHAACRQIEGASRVMVVAKSLTTLALPLAAERSTPGVWLTPLLGEPLIAGALAAVHAPTLLVGGSADPSWDRSRAARCTVAEVLEIPGADHALQVPGDPLASLEALRSVALRVQALVTRV